MQETDHKKKRKRKKEKGGDKMIAIGSDHGGFELKTKVIAHLKEQGMECRDFGTR